jgi:hypothetical protein
MAMSKSGARWLQANNPCHEYDWQAASQPKTWDHSDPVPYDPDNPEGTMLACRQADADAARRRNGLPDRAELEQRAGAAMLRAGKVPEAPVFRAMNDRDLLALIDYYGA